MNSCYIKLLAAIISYLLGSIPFGLLIGQFKQIDIRTKGSNNIGATNVARVLGLKYGIAVLVLDGMKSLLCTLLLKEYSISLALIGLFCATMGHMFSIFLKTKGGKGVAALFIGLAGIDITAMTIFATVWVLIIARTRYASLSSICSITSIAIFEIYKLITYQTQEQSLITLTICCLGIIIVAKHKSNIKLLALGKENKI